MKAFKSTDAGPASTLPCPKTPAAPSRSFVGEGFGRRPADACRRRRQHRDLSVQPSRHRKRSFPFGSSLLADPPLGFATGILPKPLPLRNLVGADIELLRQFGQRLLPFIAAEATFGLKAGCGSGVCVSSPDLLSTASVAVVRQKIHLSHCQNLRSQL